MQKRMFVMQQKARQWRACCPEEWKPGNNNKIKLSAFYSRGPACCSFARLVHHLLSTTRCTINSVIIIIIGFSTQVTPSSCRWEGNIHCTLHKEFQVRAGATYTNLISSVQQVFNFGSGMDRVWEKMISGRVLAPYI